ncbi:MAG TPA: 2,3-bisphosphoglycerate-dependent phosphoglycerate mutase [Leptospiraceae bacterium]|nr:2,3-bisphosphoglycerate-dependent phosphoglycerate mutase [Leptospiraceae bacterium]
MSELILVRHGQSLWNLHNLFTGWVDIPLSDQGINEALKAGDRLANMNFDVVYVSTLVRAMQTALLALARNKSGRVPIVQPVKGHTDEEKKLAEWAKIYSDRAIGNSIPVYKAWQLNERYYGELQGFNKQETADKYGEEQVHIWRRSYDVPPPNGEALKDTAERTIPFFQNVIEPLLVMGKNVLISAHGNSLRSIVMHLDHLTREQVLALELKTGDPILYTMQSGKLVKGSV